MVAMNHKIFSPSRIALIAIPCLIIWALLAASHRFKTSLPTIGSPAQKASKLATLFSPPDTSTTRVQSTFPASPADSELPDADGLLPPKNLHFLVPASSRNVNLCKILVSSAILGYPSPAVLNWGQVFDDKKLVEGGSHLAKIQGTYDYLSMLDSSRDDDLVLMLDGHDVWLQLRPQVLIDRYFQIIRRSNERLRADLGEVVDEKNVRNHIIFGCQKRCWPWTFNDPPCYAVESSSLPEDIYGPNTDVMLKGDVNPYRNYRQRFINSGVLMGTVGSMRRMFEHALELLKIEPNIGSDQYIFSHILGDQQIYRELLRNKPAESVKIMNARNAKDMQPPPAVTILRHLNEIEAKVASRSDGSLDFGITLDHGSELGLNTVFAEDDTEWLRFNDAAQISRVQSERGIEPMRRRTNNISQDIMRSLPPFWTFSDEPSNVLPEHSRNSTWDQMSLFTDVWTGITPVAIHHNAHRDGMKSLRQSMWPQVWFNGYTRALYDISVYTPFIPLAVSGYDESSNREWWPYETWKGGARSPTEGPRFFKHGWLGFANMCAEFHQEVFRDDKGPWRLPEDH